MLTKIKNKMNKPILNASKKKISKSMQLKTNLNKMTMNKNKLIHNKLMLRVQIYYFNMLKICKKNNKRKKINLNLNKKRKRKLLKIKLKILTWLKSKTC